MKKIGIIGCGTIGASIAEFIQRQLRSKARVVALSDIDSKKADSLSKKIKPHPIVTNIDNLIKKSDLVIEAAGVSVSAAIARKAVSRKKSVLIMSTGGLLIDPGIIKNPNVYIPSGAICGLDGLKAASIGRVKSVSLTTRKPLKGLKGAPYFKEKGIDIDRIKRETVVYDGTAQDAIKHFPKNINVAATLSLYGLGPKRTKVKIITSPKYTKNVHEIEVEGEFGSLFARTENVPSKTNPKTSQLAIYSALAKLKEMI